MLVHCVNIHIHHVKYVRQLYQCRLWYVIVTTILKQPVIRLQIISINTRAISWCYMLLNVDSCSRIQHVVGMFIAVETEKIYIVQLVRLCRIIAPIVYIYFTNFKIYTE